MMFKQFFGCFWVRIILIILIWICSFGRDNCFYQCVAIVGSHFEILSFPYKLPTQGFWTLNTHHNFLNKRHYYLSLSHTCFSFSFSRLQAWKPIVGIHVDGIRMIFWIVMNLFVYVVITLFTSNSLLVIHLSKHQTSTHFAFDHCQYGFDL